MALFIHQPSPQEISEMLGILASDAASPYTPIMRLRVTALWRSYTRLKVPQIATELHVKPRTIGRWITYFNHYGLKGLLALPEPHAHIYTATGYIPKHKGVDLSVGDPPHYETASHASVGTGPAVYFPLPRMGLKTFTSTAHPVL